MKKHLILSAMLVMTAVLSAQPAFDNPKAVVIDVAASPGRLKDEIRVVNASHENLLSIFVSVYSPKNARWEFYGTANLTSISDTDRISSPLSGKIKEISHVAVVPSSETPLAFRIAKRNNDLFIYVISEETIDGGTFVIDANSVSGKFEDNMKIMNMSKDSGIGFDVYARKTENDGWQKAGTAFVKSAGDTDTVESILPESMAAYRYFALLPHNGASYNYHAEKKNNDLYILVQ
ncbi:MAG: hypothetical protein J1F14_08760 [Treponema sp.]|nr:hypothetical protein [Treponema sp.]